MVLGAASVCSAQGGPVLEKVWVAPETNHGQLLKIYVKASDPEGDIRWIYVSGGVGKQVTAGAPTRIKKGAGKEVNGYLYVNTKDFRMQNISGTVEVMIEDWKGNESETKSVPVKIVAKGAKAEKPPADFKDEAIGPIMLQLPERMN